MLVGCAWSETPKSDSADLVVYGKIFTSEGNQIVEAFKDILPDEILLHLTSSQKG